MTPNDPLYSGATFIPTAGTFEYSELLSDGHGVTSIISPFDFAGHPPGVPQLKRGTVMHFVPSAAGNLAWLPAVAADCNAVLAMDVDVSQVPTPPVQLYLTGKMKADAIVYVAGVDPPTAVDNLRKNGIYVETVLNRMGAMTRDPGTTLPQSMGIEPDAFRDRIVKEALDRGETLPPEGSPERAAWVEERRREARERGDEHTGRVDNRPIDPATGLRIDPPRPIDPITGLPIEPPLMAPKHGHHQEHGHHQQHQEHEK